jgi:hypothetical protein
VVDTPCDGRPLTGVPPHATLDPLHAPDLSALRVPFLRPTEASGVEAHEMAKALLGYVGAVPDRRLVDEVTFLRTRVRDLEAEIARLQTERDMEQGLRQLSQLPEPALA